MPILNNACVKFKTSLFYEICHKIFNFFLTIRKIMTCPTSVYQFASQKRGQFLFYSHVQVWCLWFRNRNKRGLLNLSPHFQSVKQWPCTQEHVFEEDRAFSLLHQELPQISMLMPLLVPVVKILKKNWGHLKIWEKAGVKLLRSANFSTLATSSIRLLLCFGKEDQ